MMIFARAPTELRIVVSLLVTVYAVAFLRCAQLVFNGSNADLFSVVYALVWLSLAIGLATFSKGGRVGTLVFLWFVVIVVPLGAINPFAAINSYAPNYPSVWKLVTWIYPFVALAVYFLHVLGKHKHSFGQL
jgi:hypothetical protein